jgi:hypothetical protein
MQAGCNAIEVIRVQVLASEQQRECGLIIHDHAPVAVEQLAARRDYRDRLDAVVLGQLAIALAVANLQHPKAGDQE